jgi:glutamine synthetase
MGNRRVRVMWTDLNGLAHGRYVPEALLDRHGHHAVTTLTMNIERDILPVQGYSGDVGYPDMSSVPVVESRRPGWEPDTDVVVADLEFHHQPLEIAPRSVLKRAVEAWRQRGFEPLLGFEMEFYVLAPDADAPGGFGPAPNPSHRVYGVGDGAGNRELLYALYDAAEHSALQLEGMMGEFHPGQYELNMAYGPALDAADRAFVSKELTREVATQRGFHVTYMGRPAADLVGSGLHVNFSLSKVGEPGNSFDDPHAEYGISDVARRCLAGMVTHHAALAALSAPLINSYKRLMPGLIAGYWANWGLDNRTSTYRVPGERGRATRIENRMPCASADPYVAAAATLQAALLGYDGGLDCGEPQAGDGDAAPNTEQHTPESLAEALSALEADGALTNAIGAEFVRVYLALRRNEVERWEKDGVKWNLDEISDWELSRYLPFY